MHTKGKRDFTPYTANSKVTKHPKFLPRKHGTEAEQKAAGRTRTSCVHPLHPFTAGPVLAEMHTGCVQMPKLLTRCYRAKCTHAPKKALYRLVGNLKGAVREITGLTHVWASHLHYHRAKKYHISMPHRQHEIWHWLWSSGQSWSI